MARQCQQLVLCAALFVATALQALSAAPADWVGSEACRSCHPDQYAAWQRGPHARGTESLAKNRARKACLACHASGEAPAGKVTEERVGCESCHGPGAGYAVEDIMRDPPLRTALGLVPLATESERDAVCRRCHQQELRLVPFQSETARARLPHGQPAAEVKP